jgi:squalene synthase HpnC
MAVDHYENFPVASLLLPRRIRRAVANIYRYARSADDIADEGDATDRERLDGLARYRAELHRIGRPAAEPRAPAGGTGLEHIFVPLAETIGRHQLPITPFFALLSAFEQDVVQKRYADFAALADYCQRSANPVGHLMLHLHGAATPANLERSDAICTALQLVNFIQDVQIDWRRGRLYLPLDECARHGVGDEDLDARRLSPAWRALMREQTDRARALLHFGAPLALALGGRFGWELRLIVQGGLRILERIEAAHYDVFMNRPELATRDWALMLWRSFTARRGTAPAPKIPL